MSDLNLPPGLNLQTEKPKNEAASTILGVLLFIGYILSAIAYFWGLVAAFERGAVWFVAAFLIPPVAVVLGFIEMFEYFF